MRLEKVEEKNYPWFKYDDMEFQIRYLDNDEMGNIEKHSTEITFDKKHQKEKELNPLKFSKRLGRKAIVNWRGMKRRNLIDLIEPNKRIHLEEGEDWKDEIEFSDEIREFIIDNMHVIFSRFLIAAAREVEAFVEQTKKEELENLKIGSGGANPQVD